MELSSLPPAMLSPFSSRVAFSSSPGGGRRKGWTMETTTKEERKNGGGVSKNNDQLLLCLSPTKPRLALARFDFRFFRWTGAATNNAILLCTVHSVCFEGNEFNDRQRGSENFRDFLFNLHDCRFSSALLLRRRLQQQPNYLSRSFE